MIERNVGFSDGNGQGGSEHRATLKLDSKIIGFDFDGTLAVWPRNSTPCYHDPSWTIARSAAIPAAIRWLHMLVRTGYTIVVITGRSESHAPSIRCWLKLFTGLRIQVIGRPNSISLNCNSQAIWKSKILLGLGAIAYVGDNLEIDESAAQIANCQFIDAACFLRGDFPALITN
jgi:hypothetical protein